ncbi:MAG: hypothetical protein ACU0C9_10970, partial [Paracoccaceae bacterium]
DSAQLFLQRYGAGTNNTNAAIKDPVPGTMLNLQAEIVESEETEPKDPQTIPVSEFSQRAIDIIRAEADDLHQEDKFGELPGASDILDECVNTANQLVEIFESGSSTHSDCQELHDDLMEAADMMLLMQLEQGDGPAADAVTLLLQLRREMETSLAA